MKEGETEGQAVADHHLLALAKRGDERAFVTLFHRHRAPVVRFVIHMCGSKEIAEEVTQEVFLALLSQEAKYSQSLGDLRAFLIGIARNQVRKQLRKSRRTCNWELAPEAITNPDAFERVSMEQRIEALQLAILQLPARYREAIVLCEIEGMDLAQASEQLGCALGTVKSRLNRARTILRAKLRDREGCPA